MSSFVSQSFWVVVLYPLVYLLVCSSYLYVTLYAEEYGIKDSDVKKFVQRKDLLPIDDSAHTLVRDPNKCILCGACVRACEEHQEIAVLGFTNRGSRTVIQPMVGKNLMESECIGCG